MSTKQERRERTRFAPDARRAAILDAAAEVVVERGLADTRITDIAERVGVSHGLVHYYFPTKDALVGATMHHLADADIARLRRTLAAQTDARHKVDRLLRSAVPTARSKEGWVLWVDAWSVGLRDLAVREVHEELDGAWSCALREVIENGVAQGAFTCSDPARASTRLTALVDGLCLRLVLDHHGMSRSTVLSLLREAAETELGTRFDVTRRDRQAPARRQA